jgi:ABC-type sugar transport system substrate-binding protein
MRHVCSIAVTVVLLGTAAIATAQAGDKVQICHSTASATNPYVLIDVSANAADTHLNGHGQKNSTDFVFDPSFDSCAAQLAGGPL